MSFNLIAYGSKITLDFSFQQNSGLPMRHISRASWHVAILQARQELQGACRRATSSLKTILEGFGKPLCFPMTTSISSSTKTCCEEWIHSWEMHKPLAVTFSSTQKSSVPLCDFPTTGGWSASPPDWFSWSQQYCTIYSGVWADVQRPRGRGSSPAPAAGCLGSASA